MNSIVAEILVVLLLLVLNGIFSLSEMALVSARKTRLQSMAESGSSRAQAALKLANDPGEFLSTAQIGITLVGIVAGAYGGATFAAYLTPMLAPLPGVGRFAESLAFTIVVSLITYLSLIIGELVPKHIALSNPERIAITVAGPMRLLSRLSSPLVTLLTASTNLVTRLLRIKPSEEAPVSEDEIKVMIEQGAHAGIFDRDEQQLIHRVFRFGDRKVEAVMTPRTDLEWLDLTHPLEALQAQIIASPYSRFLVCDGDLDNVVGMVHTKQLLNVCLQGNGLSLQTALQQPEFVPEGTRAQKALDWIRQTGAPLAVVVDEYGSVIGMVTQNDILRALVGEIAEDISGEEHAHRREDGSWLLDGMMPFDEMLELLDVRGSASGDYHTLAGFILDQLGRIPVPSDNFDWEGYRFEVVDMDGHRVDKVLAAPRSAVTEEEEGGTA